MKLLGKLYLTGGGLLVIHAKHNGKLYLVERDGSWTRTWLSRPPRHWRLIGDSYAKN